MSLMEKDGPPGKTRRRRARAPRAWLPMFEVIKAIGNLTEWPGICLPGPFGQGLPGRCFLRNP